MVFGSKVICGLAIGAALLTSGCASVFNDKTQRINVTTSTGVKVEATIDGMPIEVPGIATVTRTKSDKILSTKDPKCNQTTLMASNMDNAFFANILSGGFGLSGSTTDYLTEKMWKYEDTTIISCRN